MISVLATLHFLSGVCEMISYFGGLSKTTVEDLRACVPIKRALDMIVDVTVELDAMIRNCPFLRDTKTPSLYIDLYKSYTDELIHSCDILAQYINYAYTVKHDSDLEIIQSCLTTVTQTRAYLGVYE